MPGNGEVRKMSKVGEVRGVAVDLFLALERIMRAGQNGHPAGHDAVVAAKRTLKRATQCGIMPRPANLECHCSACATAKRVREMAAKAGLTPREFANAFNRMPSAGNRRKLAEVTR